MGLVHTVLDCFHDITKLKYICEYQKLKKQLYSSSALQKEELHQYYREFGSLTEKLPSRLQLPARNLMTDLYKQIVNYTNTSDHAA